MGLASSGSDKTTIYRETDEFGIVINAKRFHDAVFVECYCSWRKKENFTRCLHRIAFGKQLQDLALPYCQLVGQVPPASID